MMADFNRESKTFEQLVTFTRASTGTYYDAQGVLRTAAVDEKRLTHDPETGEALGLLIEEQRTNLLLWSEALDNAAWAKINGLTVTANASVSPDGTTTADDLVTDGAGICQIHQDSSVLTDATLSSAWYLEKTTADRFHICLMVLTGGTQLTFAAHFNSFTGAIEDIGPEFAATGASLEKVQVDELADFWRITLVAKNNSSGNLTCRNAMQPNRGTAFGDFTLVAGTVAAWGAQLETGSFPTSYIKTEGAQVTRAVENASVDTLAPWFNAEAYSVFTEQKVLVDDNSAGNMVFEFNDGTLDSRVLVYYHGNNSPGVFQIFTRQNTTNQLATSGDTGVRSGDVFRAAVVFSKSAGKFILYVNGSKAIELARSFNHLLVSSLRIGKAPDKVYAGAYMNTRCIPRALSATELEELTAP